MTWHIHIPTLGISVTTRCVHRIAMWLHLDQLLARSLSSTAPSGASSASTFGLGGFGAFGRPRFSQINSDQTIWEHPGYSESIRENIKKSSQCGVRVRQAVTGTYVFSYSCDRLQGLAMPHVPRTCFRVWLSFCLGLGLHLGSDAHAHVASDASYSWISSWSTRRIQHNNAQPVKKDGLLGKERLCPQCHIKMAVPKRRKRKMTKSQDNHRKSNKFVKSCEVSLGFTDSSVVAAASPSRALPAWEIALLKIA